MVWHRSQSCLCKHLIHCSNTSTMGDLDPNHPAILFLLTSSTQDRIILSLLGGPSICLFPFKPAPEFTCMTIFCCFTTFDQDHDNTSRCCPIGDKNVSRRQ
jgi:hypothetical protein